MKAYLRRLGWLWALSVIVFTVAGMIEGSLFFPAVLKALAAATLLNAGCYITCWIYRGGDWRNWVALTDAPVYRKSGDKFIPYYIAEKGDKVRLEKILFNERHILLTNGCYISFDETSNWEMPGCVVSIPIEMIVFKDITDGKRPGIKPEDVFLKA